MLAAIKQIAFNYQYDKKSIIPFFHKLPNPSMAEILDLFKFKIFNDMNLR